MITPTFNDNITVYHCIKRLDEATKRNVTEWQRQVYTDCYFGIKEVETLSGNTLTKANSYTVRIPSDGTVLPVIPGDLVVLGAVNDEISDTQGNRTSDLIERYKPNVCTVRTVRDNTKIPLGSHFAIGGV